MDNIPNKTDGVDTLADSEFNSHKNELQTLVTESGQTLAIGTTDQLRKAISIFGRAIYAQDSSGAANTLTLSRPTALTDINAYYNGLTVIFDTPNANTGATTATLNGLASKKVLRPDDTDLIVGDILPGVTYTLVYNTALDSAAGAFELKEIGAKLWDKQTVTHNMTSDADYILTAEQNKFGKVIITDTNPFLTVPKNIIVSDKQKDFIFHNDTLQILTVKTSGGTGIAVAAGAKVWLLCDGTNVIDAVDAAGSAGKLLQEVYVENTTYSSTAAVVAYDDTVPLISEGAEILTSSFTPTVIGSSIKVEIQYHGVNSAQNTRVLSVFNDSVNIGVGALVTSSNFISGINVDADFTSVALSAVTISARIGANAGTTYVNGDTSARKWGGALKTTMRITEIGA